jgi:hypothetical protein
MFTNIFRLPMRLEVKTELISSGALEGSIYPFGADNMFFEIPIKLFRVSTTAYACLFKLLYSPGQMPEGSTFGASMSEVENSEIRHTQFGLNASLNASFSRLSLVIALCVSLCTAASVIQAQSVGENQHLVMRVLVQGALKKLALEVAKQEFRQQRPTITDKVLSRIDTLVETCSRVSTFNSHSLMDVAVLNFEDVCKSVKIPVKLE